MRQFFEKIFTLGYVQYKGLGISQEGVETAKLFRDLAEQMKPLAKMQDLHVQPSVGRGRWATVPWIRVYDKKVARKPTKGLYIVYLFAESGKSVFLTLNQGVENASEEDIARLKNNIQAVVKTNTFEYNKGALSDVGKYGGSTLFFKEYRPEALPSDDVLKYDLNEMMAIYKECINQQLTSPIESYKIKIPAPISMQVTVSNKLPIKKLGCHIQKIFFGAPGTGKSHAIDYSLFEDENKKRTGLRDHGNPVIRTTFHPDYDYAQFVGAYKPKKESGVITYSFVPQVFAKAYATAWKSYLSANKADVFLVIEEINRGNCAQIFGDIFQLLDRDEEGFSQYSIDADNDFATWLKEESVLKDVWPGYVDKVGEGKLKLPPNLNILATMNTSDQSLFPMDSAFKRRFDWEYVPIKYAKDDDCGENWDADEFKIVIGNSEYKWLDFLEKVNADIYDATRREDKQMGEFFIKPKDGKTILFGDFRSKVLFYLWDSVYKDETERQTVFHFPYGDGDDKIKSVTFQSLFGKNAEGIVNEIMKKLDVKNVNG